MIIKLTATRDDIFGTGDVDEVILVNERLISTIEPDEDDGGCFILIPPYQKPIKVRESANQVSRLIK